MDILLDTCTALWLLSDDRKLSKAAKEYLSDSNNNLFISTASIWEFAIKRRLGKLGEYEYNSLDFYNLLYDIDIDILNIVPHHASGVENLPLIHTDPFDRLIISTAIFEELIILTNDDNIIKYDIQYLW